MVMQQNTFWRPTQHAMIIMTKAKGKGVKCNNKLAVVPVVALATAMTRQLQGNGNGSSKNMTHQQVQQCSGIHTAIAMLQCSNLQQHMHLTNMLLAAAVIESLIK